MATHSEHEAQQIRETILGGFIDSVTITRDKEGFGFTVSKGKENFVVWVDSDPEGNGPGHLSIEKRPAPKNKKTDAKLKLP